MTPHRASEFFLSLFDKMAPKRVPLLVATGALIVLAAIPLTGVRLDMSLRAFNSDDPRDVATAAKYEEIFGLRLGTYGGVVIEDDHILSDGFFSMLDSLSGMIERLDNVSEVLSLTRFSVPDWTRGGALTEPFTRHETGVWKYDGFPDYKSPIEERAEQVLDEVKYPPSRMQYMELSYLASLAQDSSKYAGNDRLDSIRTDPRLNRVLLSEDGKSTLILARIDVPMKDIEGRARIMDGVEAAIHKAAPGIKYRLIGYSHVENEFADVVLFSLLQTFLLTFLVIGALLWAAYRRTALVITALTGVSLATACTAGLLTLLGQNLTMINSMVPVVILIIGAADAIHMLQSFQAYHLTETRDVSVRKMFGEMGWPCFLTAVTTAGGFLGLSAANIIAIRDFGLNVAIGVLLVYLFNLVFIPATLSAFSEERIRASTWLSRSLGGWSGWSAQFVLTNSRQIALFAVVAVFIAALSVQFIEVNQFANGEVSDDTPLRADQTFLETNFAGFLGPDIAVRRKDGARLTRRDDIVRLRALSDALRRMPEVDRVECYCDFIPLDASRDSIEAQIQRLHADPRFNQRMRSMINSDADIASVAVYIGDIGTSRVRNLIDDVESLTFRFLGYDYNAEQYGYWWLAQQGIMNMVRDMLFSFGTSLLIILPILALSLGSVRLFIVSLAPNLLPMLFALAFAAWTGIPIRIGTTMVLAIAIGIAVDDTIHVMIHVRSRLAEGTGYEEAIRRTMQHSGAAVLLTSVVLVAGFLSMRVNDLLAIQDMGLLAAATLLVAFLSDVYLAPSILHLLSKGREKSLSLDGIRMIGP